MVQKSSWQGFVHVALIGLCLNAFITCSCKKSDNDEVASYAIKDAERAAEAAQTGMENWMKTNRVNLQKNSNVLASAEHLAQVAPELARISTTNEILLETERAAIILQKLYEGGHLPGVVEGDKGEIGSDKLYTVVSNKTQVISYPTFREFHLVKDGDDSTNYYFFSKQSKDSEWKLQKAWQTDSNGQTIQEWPIK